MIYKEYYVYDESSPSCLRWNRDVYSGRWKNFKNVSVGDAAGGLGNSGYYQVRKEGKLHLVHRVIWEMHYGEIEAGKFVDHIDGDRLNNKLPNLRLVSKQGNARNCTPRKDNSSGIVGVYLCTNTLKSGTIISYWKAFWTDLTGRPKSKSFRVDKLGSEIAYSKAIEHRLQMISDLNELGAGYTKRHLLPI